jgi:ABC-type phosphate/phosphonate transport system permease subunit
VLTNIKVALLAKKKKQKMGQRHSQQEAYLIRILAHKFHCLSTSVQLMQFSFPFFFILYLQHAFSTWAKLFGCSKVLNVLSVNTNNPIIIR